jgi:endonuclease/exonuclease/phosphatase family metal-dependent hydrolase
MKPLRVATWNIHKGFSLFNRRVIVHELRERLRSLDADIIFLQEVQGEHREHAQRHASWPVAAQHEFLAEEVWAHTAYGRNVVYDAGHHGNAILSRYPIAHSHNQDVTHLRFEKRGLLHCAIEVPKLREPLHCVSAHLSLLGGSRKRQADALALRVREVIPDAAPLLIAGDFNDWRNQAGPRLAQHLGLDEAHTLLHQRPALSFPAGLPLLPLDRIYVRGLDVAHSAVQRGLGWARLSDHAPLCADLIVRKPWR